MVKNHLLNGVTRWLISIFSNFAMNMKRKKRTQKSLARFFYPLIITLGRKKLQRVFNEEPIVIGGCARSGTTLLMSVLSAHEKIYTFSKEIGAFNSWQETTGGLYPTRIDRLYRNLLTHNIPEESTRFCTKAPSNIRHIPEIMDFFNQKVKFIHIVRDARDVLLSKHPDSKDEFWVKPERWIKDVSEGLAYQNHPKVYTLKYEDLIMDYEKTMRNLLDFLELEFTNQIKNWHENTKVRQSNAIFENEIKNLHQQSIGKWKNPEYRGRVNKIMEYDKIKTLLQELDYIK